MKTKLVLAILFLFSLASALVAQPSAEFQRELAEYIRENYRKREVMIPMRDDDGRRLV